MKKIIKDYWIVLAAFFVLSTSANAQISTPSETKKQAETETRAEQKKEKDRKHRAERVASKGVKAVNLQPQYKKTVRKKEKQLLRPVVSREKKK